MDVLVFFKPVLQLLLLQKVIKLRGAAVSLLLRVGVCLGNTEVVLTSAVFQEALRCLHPPFLVRFKVGLSILRESHVIALGGRLKGGLESVFLG